MPKMTEKRCRQIVADRSEGFCERCCSNQGTTMHHRLKRSQGGLWTCENIVALCGHGTAGCHGWVEHNPDAAEYFGWHIRPGKTPADEPVKWRMSTWALLTPEGTVKPVENWR